jgi:hypothetical protein
MSGGFANFRFDVKAELHLRKINSRDSNAECNLSIPELRRGGLAVKMQSQA